MRVVHRATHSAALCAAVLVLQGCSVDEAQEIATYRAVLDSNPLQISEEDDQQTAPLGIARAMRLSTHRNEVMGLDGERYLRAIIDSRRAAAAFLPTLSLSPSYTLRDRAGSQRRSVLDVPVVAGMRVNPVADRAGVREADERIEEERGRLLEAQDALLLDVARAVYEVIRAEREVLVFERSIQVQAERVRDSRVRRDVGLVSPLDVSLSESALADTRARAIEAQARVRRGRELLAFLCGAPIGDRPLLDDLEPADAPVALTKMEAVARQWRGELAASFAARRAAVARVERAYGEYWPSVSVDVRAFLSRQSEPSGMDWSSLISLHLPLFSAGLIEAQVREALSLLRSAQYELSLAWRGIQRDIAVAQMNLAAAAERTEQRRIDVQAARQALAQAEGLQDVGLAVNLERLEAQDRLLRAELELVNAELDQRIFTLDLRRAVGTIHEVAGLERQPLMEWDESGDNTEARRAAR